MLDQREAGEGPDDITPRHGGFILRRQDRKGFAVGAGELHAGGFHEFARRRGAESRDDAITGEPRFTILGVDDRHPRIFTGAARFKPDQ